MSAPVWEELVATALLGTERRPPSRPAPGDSALARMLDGLPWDDPEAALLGAAGVLTGYRAAGWQPARTAEPPVPAPPDPRPLCSPGADAILARLLESGPGFMIGEWLRLALVAGVRPAPEHLPGLLDAAVAGSLRAAVLTAGGDRLRWLAAHDERWSWAAGGATAGAGVEERWRTGTRDERLALLRAIRDENPARGRELLASTWSQDGATDRALLVQAIAVGLHDGDEPFLEAALDDRSKLVRQQAAELLAGLPSSALADRMAQRVRALVSVEGRLRRRLHAQTPDEPDDAARRDGIDDAGRPHDLGPGAWRLVQLVGAAPLATWGEITGADAAATYALARGADHEQALRLGWSRAARRQRDSPWLTMLARETGDPGLIASLAPGAVDEVAPALLGTTTGAFALTELLERIPGPWGPALSRAVSEQLGRALAGADDLYGIRLGHVAAQLDVRLRDTVTSDLQPVLQRDLQPSVRRQLDELLANLDLRHAMTRELTPR